MIRRAISLVVIVWLLGFAAFAVTLPRPLGPMKTDAIIVPTGGPGRIETGLERLEAGDARRMLITGVNRDVKPSELAAEYGRPVAVFDCCVSLGFDASDTRSNALEVSRWLVRRKYKSIRLVTADWHMRRARYELERVLPDDVKIYDDGVRSTPSLATLWKEYNKYVLRRLGAVLGL